MGLKLPQSSNKQSSIFEVMLNSTLRSFYESSAKTAIAVVRGNFKKLNMTEGLPALFSTLWYSTLPCFDVQVLMLVIKLYVLPNFCTIGLHQQLDGVTNPKYKF